MKLNHRYNKRIADTNTNVPTQVHFQRRLTDVTNRQQQTMEINYQRNMRKI